MVTLVIQGCVPDKNDPNRVIDAYYGDGFYLRHDRAIELALSGAVSFKAQMRGFSPPADVRPYKSVSGNWYLKTHPDSTVRNNLGTLTSRPPLSALQIAMIRGRLRNALDNSPTVLG